MKDSWLTISPSSGEGNSIILNKGDDYKGRLLRSTVVTIKAQGVEEKTYKVNQEAYSEYIFVNETSFNIGKEGGIIAIKGNSNSPLIEYALTNENQIPIQLPSEFSYKQNTNSGEGNNGEVIPSDPGAIGEYEFIISIFVPSNDVGDRVGKITLMGQNPKNVIEIIINQENAIFTINYTKGDYIENISKSTEEVDYGNSATCEATLLPNTAQYTYTFDGWYEGENKISSDLALEVKNITNYHNFEAKGLRTLNKYQIIAEANPSENGSVSGGGEYNYGEEVELIATPNEGYHFVNWEDSDSEGSTRTITVLKNATYTANFSINIYTAKATSEIGGSAYVTLNSSTEGSTSLNVEHGSEVTWNAVASEGYRFNKWSNGSSSTENPLVLIVTEDITCTATFIKTYNVSINPSYRIKESGDWINGNVGGVVTGEGTFDTGSSVTVTAEAKEGFEFIGWYEGDIEISILSSYTFDIDSNKNLTAKFQRIWYDVTFLVGTGINTVSNNTRVQYQGSVEGTATLLAGYTNIVWSKVSGQATIEDNGNGTVSISNILSAVEVEASAELKTYTITYNKGIGIKSLSRTSEIVKHGENALGSTAVLLEGYNFGGWYKDNVTVSSELTYIPQNVQSDMIFEARASIKSFTITANNSYRDTDGIGDYALGEEGGSVSGGGVFEYGTKVTLVATPNEDYIFDGWYSALNDGSLLSSDLSYIITESLDSNKTVYARFTKKYFTVSYEKGDYVNLNTPTSERVIYGGTAKGSTMTILEDTDQYDYEIDGWYLGTTKQNNTAKSPIATNVTENIIYTSKATRTIKDYVVSYVAGDYIDSVTPTSEVVQYGSNAVGSTAVVLNNITQYTYTWDGWYTASVGGQKVSSNLTYAPTNIIAAVTYYARATRSLNQYTISVSAEYRNTDNTGSYTAGTTGGSASGGKKGDYGTSVTITATPATGYEFVEWSDGNKNASRSVIISGNASYTARFQKKYYTITYKAGEYISSISRGSERVAYGSNALGSIATILENTAQYTYTFGEWVISGTSTSVETELKLIPQNVTANASYTANALRTLNNYTISYEVNDYGTLDKSSQSVAYGSTGSCIFTIPANTAQYTYTWHGWYTALNGGGTKITSSNTLTTPLVTGKATYYAYCTRRLNIYTINYVANVGSVSPTSQSIAYGSTGSSEAIIPANTAQYTYTFIGWFTGNNGTGTKLTDSTILTTPLVTGKATYYAYASRSTNSYTHTFNGNGGNTPSPSTITKAYGSTLGTLPTCTKNSSVSTSYTFAGWFDTSAASGGTQATTSTTITGAKTWYARWTESAINYTVSFVADGYTSSVSRTSEIVRGGNSTTANTASIPADTSTYSYSFQGWYTAAGGKGTRITTSTILPAQTITSNRTYYAYTTRTLKTYTINYSASGYVSSVSRASANVSAGGTAASSTASVPANTAQYTYTWHGWYTAANGGGSRVSTEKTYGPTNVLANATYYAYASRSTNSYTHTFNGNGGNTPSPSTITKAYGSTLGTLPTCSRSGYNFVGWFDTSSASGGTQATTSTTITGAKTWYARWQVATATVSVSLDSSSAGRGSVSGGGTYNIGSNVTVICTLNKSDDVFGGWYNGTTQVSTSTNYTFAVPSGGISLRALIYYIDVTPTSLEFEANGGTKSFTVTSNVDGWTIS